jgi:hypothetical protein
MPWKCTKRLINESGIPLFVVGNIYHEEDDRGEADDIAICLISEQGRRIYLIDEMVRDNFDEV